MTTTETPRRPRKARIDKVGIEWRAWVPVRDAGDYDESGRHPAAPYGESFWPSQERALKLVLAVIELERPG